MSEKKAAPWLRIYAVLAYVYIYLPILILIVFSFNSQKLNIRWEGFTLRWYGVLLRDQEVLLAARNSILIAVVSTLVATVIGTMAALALQRYRFPGYTLADAEELYGDSPAQAALWQSGSDVSKLAGQPVRLRFVLRDADLYAMQFGERE